MSLAANMIADRYRLDDRIAVGGMGEVWRAADTVLGRPVAVKLLRADYAADTATLARFRAEARHAGKLSHPGIAQVYDYGEAGPAHSPYLVMELVPGPPLTERLSRGPLAPADTMYLVAQVAGGLAAAHAAGLVHRDIKPGNLLLDPDGRVKITDFGIAHAVGAAPVTHTGMLIGTPGYLAPERVSGASATAASDLYSLGIVAFECLAGAPPFGGTGVEVALAHRDRPLPPLPRTVPAAVAALITRMTAKDPAARPDSAAEVARLAAHLRAELLGGGWIASQADPAGPVPAPGPAPDQTLSYPLPDPLAGPAPGAGAGYEPLPPDRAWPPRRVALAVVAAAVVAGLAGWLLASTLAARPSGAQLTSRPPATATSTPPGTVAVNPAALTGEPLSLVRQQLTQLGLQVTVHWRASQQRTGTVLLVQPGGRVPVGSVIAVTAAFRIRGHDHGHGHDNGNGNGDGGGGGGGG